MISMQDVIVEDVIMLNTYINRKYRIGFIIID